MNSVTWKGRPYSQLMLGTVQFGMPYGIANQTGQPEVREVSKIVARAIEGGVNCFDTAAAYGTSEEVLGHVLQDLKVADRVTVVTKVRPCGPLEEMGALSARQAIEKSIADSRSRLKIDCLPVVLFHRENEAIHIDVLEDLRARGWIDQIGVSCDNRPGPAARFVNEGHFSALQIPGNILDRRHEQSGLLELTAIQGVAVFVRSVYLQGLLAMPEDQIPAALVEVIPARQKLSALAEAAGMQLAEMALRYILSRKGVTCVITGVETVAQIEQNLTMFDRGSLPDDLLQAIESMVFEIPERIITPSQWPPKAAI